MEQPLQFTNGVRGALGFLQPLGWSHFQVQAQARDTISPLILLAIRMPRFVDLRLSCLHNSIMGDPFFPVGAAT